MTEREYQGEQNDSKPFDFQYGIYHFYNHDRITPGKLVIRDSRYFPGGIKVTGKDFDFYREKGLIPTELSRKLLSGSENIQLTAIATGLDKEPTSLRSGF